MTIPNIIISHPRSGLHLLRCSLWCMSHENYSLSLSELEKWNVLHNAHGLNACGIGPCKINPINHNKTILLLRDPLSLYALGKHKYLGQEVGLKINHYCDLLKHFDKISLNNKMIVYFEDIKFYDAKIFEVCTFLGLPLINTNMKQIRKDVLKFYVETNHKQMKNKINISHQERQAVNKTLIHQLGNLYNNYLFKYETL